VDGMGDGIVALQGDHRQRVDGQLGAEHGEESGQLAEQRHLPRNGKHAELAQGGRIHNSLI